MCEARIVNRGIDTLVVNIYYTDLGRPIRRDINTALATRLDEWKHMAQELGESFITPWVFNWPQRDGLGSTNRRAETRLAGPRFFTGSTPGHD